MYVFTLVFHCSPKCKSKILQNCFVLSFTCTIHVTVCMVVYLSSLNSCITASNTTKYRRIHCPRFCFRCHCSHTTATCPFPQDQKKKEQSEIKEEIFERTRGDTCILELRTCIMHHIYICMYVHVQSQQFQVHT